MNEKILELEQRIAELEEKVLRLAVCKIGDKNYSYYNWLLEGNIDEDQRFKIETILAYFNFRLEGKMSSTYEMKFKRFFGEEFIERQKSKVPRYNEFVEAIFNKTDIQNEDLVKKMLKSLESQGMYQELTTYLINDIDKN